MHHADEIDGDLGPQPTTSSSPSSFHLNSGSLSQSNTFSLSPSFPLTFRYPDSYASFQNFQPPPVQPPTLYGYPTHSQEFNFASPEAYPHSWWPNLSLQPAKAPERFENFDALSQTSLLSTDYSVLSTVVSEHTIKETFPTPSTSIFDTIRLKVSGMPSRWRADTQIKLRVSLFEEPNVLNPSHPEHYSEGGEVVYPIKTLSQYNHLRILTDDARGHHLDEQYSTALRLYLSVVGNASRREIRCCDSCQERERKSNSKKPAASAGPNHRTSLSPADVSFPLACANRNVVPLSNGSALIKFRITCYGRHHPHEDGFRVLMTLEDSKQNVLATTLTTPVIIADDHKQIPRLTTGTRRQISRPTNGYNARTETSEQSSASTTIHTPSSLHAQSAVDDSSNAPLINCDQTTHRLVISPIHSYELQGQPFSGDGLDGPTLPSSSTIGNTANTSSTSDHVTPDTQPPVMSAALQRAFAAFDDDCEFDLSSWRTSASRFQTNVDSSRAHHPSPGDLERVRPRFRARYPGHQ